PGATSYNLYRATASGGEGTAPYRTGQTNTSFTDIGLTNGVTYYYQVTAVNPSGESAKSTEVSAMPRPTTTGVAVDAGGAAAGTFIADTYFSGSRTGTVNWGSVVVDTSGVANPAPQMVYQTERYGDFTYSIPRLTAGAG